MAPSTAETLAIIPARGGSKRFPRKNVARLSGKPLIAYSVQAARDAGVFSSICVSSDDKEILAVAEEAGADVALARPPELASDQARVPAVCRHVLSELDPSGERFDMFGLLLPTTPLRSPGDIREAHERLRGSDANYLMSLVPFGHPPQRAVWIPGEFVEPFFGHEYMVRTQDLEKLYRHDGSIIFARRDAFLKEAGFYGSRVLPYIIQPHRSVDIDQPIDLAWAEFLLHREDRQDTP